MSDNQAMARMAGDADAELPKPRANRPLRLSDRVEFLCARALLGFFRLIGVDAASAVAGRTLRIAGPLIRPIARRAEDNLRRAFPDWSEKEIRRTTADVFENLGRTTAEFSRLGAFRQTAVPARVEIHGRERLEAIRTSGKPVILVSGHFANWETMPIAIRDCGLDFALVYRAANNPLIDELIIRLRAQTMTRRQIPKGKRGGRALIDALSSGRSLAMLVDQKLNDGIPAPLMGRDAMTPPAAARLSLKYGAPVTPVGVVRLKGAYFRVTVGEPIAFTPSGDSQADIRTLTILINQEIERGIRAHPGQWLWLHRRWPKDEG